ncbi:nuclear transport factor 2 family protein [Sphingobacterium sp. WQ 366]|uniref:Nuclear transport factor 2 family protein n=1 Tax=Sphingobacterium bovistauri TaxID=2781959 RepID=A0ABS7Z1Z5_9SPHI|nr:nuclear transport factor 2 family protein [Sphingobacterium bovistauri]
MKNFIKCFLIGLFLSWNVSITYAQDKNVEQEIITLSKNKWQWMAEKNVNVLDSLFHEKSVYVHMSGSWDKAREMDVIRSGSIWYKNAVVHDVSVNIVNNTAVLLNRIDLQAVVRGNEVTNPFVVTEVYVKENEKWKLLSLSFTKILTPN